LLKATAGITFRGINLVEVRLGGIVVVVLGGLIVLLLDGSRMEALR
jgi:hypothetical protein